MDHQLALVPYEGGVTLVNFWATWCEPCRQEMPELQRLQEKLGALGLTVVGMNLEIETPHEDLLAHLEEYEITYPILRFDKRWAWPGVATVPTSFLIASDGKILRKYVGAKPEQVEGLVRDIEDVIYGRPLKPMVMPDPPAADSEE